MWCRRKGSALLLVLLTGRGAGGLGQEGTRSIALEGEEPVLCRDSDTKKVELQGTLLSLGHLGLFSHLANGGLRSLLDRLPADLGKVRLESALPAGLVVSFALLGSGLLACVRVWCFTTVATLLVQGGCVAGPLVSL